MDSRAHCAFLFYVVNRTIYHFHASELAGVAFFAHLNTPTYNDFHGIARNFITSSAYLSTINVCITLHHTFHSILEVCLTQKHYGCGWRKHRKYQDAICFSSGYSDIAMLFIFSFLFSRPPSLNDIKTQVNVIILVYIRILQLTFALRNGGKNYIYTAST